MAIYVLHAKKTVNAPHTKNAAPVFQLTNSIHPTNAVSVPMATASHQKENASPAIQTVNVKKPTLVKAACSVPFSSMVLAYQAK